MGRVREEKRREEKRREEKKKEDQKEKVSEERRSMIQVPEKVGKSRNTVFFSNDLWF